MQSDWSQHNAVQNSLGASSGPRRDFTASKHSVSRGCKSGGLSARSRSENLKDRDRKDEVKTRLNTNGWALGSGHGPHRLGLPDAAENTKWDQATDATHTPRPTS
jgi:hypothetical protein